jgi:hypothetical protein
MAKREQQLAMLAAVNVGLANEVCKNQSVRLNDVELLALRITELEKQLADKKKADNAIIAALELRNVELESMLQSKNFELSKLVHETKEIETEIQKNETKRLSQLQALAARNTALEKEVLH